MEKEEIFNEDLFSGDYIAGNDFVLTDIQQLREARDPKWQHSNLVTKTSLSRHNTREVIEDDRASITSNGEQKEKFNSLENSLARLKTIPANVHQWLDTKQSSIIYERIFQGTVNQYQILKKKNIHDKEQGRQVDILLEIKVRWLGMVLNVLKEQKYQTFVHSVFYDDESEVGDYVLDFFNTMDPIALLQILIDIVNVRTDMAFGSYQDLERAVDGVSKNDIIQAQQKHKRLTTLSRNLVNVLKLCEGAKSRNNDGRRSKSSGSRSKDSGNVNRNFNRNFNRNSKSSGRNSKSSQDRSFPPKMHSPMARTINQN